MVRAGHGSRSLGYEEAIEGTLAQVVSVSSSADYLITKQDYDTYRERTEDGGIRISTLPRITRNC
jgi:hypothetical protein